MFAFIAENWGTIVVSAVVAGIVAAIVTKMVRDKKRGKCVSCDCGCAGCKKACSYAE